MKYFLYILFILGMILANYTTEWNWEHIKLFISGGLTGIWVMLLAKKALQEGVTASEVAALWG